MKTDQERIHKFLDLGEFKELFNYLGWDNPQHELFPSLEDRAQVTPVAEKRGVGVWRVGKIPPAAVRRRIDRDVSRRTRERLLIFEGDDRQLWLWPETRPSGSGHHLVTHEYHPGTRNESLAQRLAGIGFTVEEEDSLTVMDVLQRVRGQFKADKVTKQFYKKFLKIHERLTRFIEGIKKEKDRELYSTVLLNRLMFIYFMQKKGFMEDDRDYLRNRLGMVRNLHGEDSFYGFFRKFLLPLFHEGLGSHRHLYDDPEIAKIIGKIPYVNGAIFDPHSLEEEHAINIRDREFEHIFDFFDEYRWHLDERPTYQPNEINPDVLGYVFEQLMNHEQGAYYTHEDITGYMTSATIIPTLLDRLDVDDDPMDLLTADPERYIHESVSYGIDKELPEDIEAGASNPTQIVDEDWFKKAPPNIGLPGETWWETINRHRYYANLKERVAAGEIQTVDDAITANLDLRTLITDFLGMLTPIESVESAYRTLRELTILDPTCGSGAFLFAALDILADCYKALLDRAEDLSINEDTPEILREADEHPNRMYFIYKQSMLHNLYGVDIKREAGEIARLRMFLKLAAQLTDPDNIEPLPDLEFNIKTGNLLVGIAHIKDAEERIGSNLIGRTKLEDIKQRSKPLATLLETFSLYQQRNVDPDIINSMKLEIKKEQANLRNNLDKYLYEVYKPLYIILPTEEGWITKQYPFHWFVEFPNIFINKEGFDLIIGNPPFINRSRIPYKIQGYKTRELSDIYAPCIERTLQLINQKSCYSMVLPPSSQVGEKYTKLRNEIVKSLHNIWVSTYTKLPDTLFPSSRLNGHVILIGNNISQSDRNIFSTKFMRWTKDYRPFLFENIRYKNIPTKLRTNANWLKLGSSAETEILERLLSNNYTIGSLSKKGKYFLYYKPAVWNYLSTFIIIPPAFTLYGTPTEQTNIGCLEFPDASSRNTAFVLSLSKISLLWWASTGGGFTLTKGGFYSIPIPNQPSILKELEQLSSVIEENLYKTLGYRKNAGKWNGNYDVRKIRHLTDQVDRLILASIGLEDHWPALQLFYASFTKQSRDQSVLLKKPNFENYGLMFTHNMLV